MDPNVNVLFPASSRTLNEDSASSNAIQSPFYDPGQSAWISILLHAYNLAAGVSERERSGRKGSYSVYLDEATYYAKNVASGEIEFSGPNAQVVIQAAMDALTSGGVVQLSEDTYAGSYDDRLTIRDNVTLRGSGPNTILNTLRINIRGSNVRLSDLRVTGAPNAYAITVGTSEGSISGIIIERVVADHLTGITVSGITIYANEGDGSISNVTISDCRAHHCTGYGFALMGSGEGATISKVRMINCIADHNGGEEGGEWGVGFNLMEADKALVEDVLLIGCRAEYNWESGYHMDAVYTQRRYVLVDCYAGHNGQKPSPVFGNGFTVSGDLVLENCHSEHNSGKGFALLHKRQDLLRARGCRSNDNGAYGFLLTFQAAGHMELYNCRSDSDLSGYFVEGSGTNGGSALLVGCKSYNAQRWAIYHNLAANITYCGFLGVSPGGYGGGAVVLSDDSAPSKDVAFDGTLIGDASPAVYHLLRIGNATRVEVSGSITSLATNDDAVYAPGSSVVFKRCRIHAGGVVGIGANATSTIEVEDTIIDDNGAGNLVYGMQGNASSPPYVHRGTVRVIGATTPYLACEYDQNSGYGTGTGVQQTIAHGLVATPSRVYLGEYSNGGAEAYQSAPADASNIYLTAVSGRTYTWRAEL